MTTAALSVPVSAQATASSPTPVSDQPQSPNYLQRLVQDLDPKVAAHHNFCKRAFEIAQIVSQIIVPILIGLAAGIVVVLSLASPLAPILAIPLAIGILIAAGFAAESTTRSISDFLKNREQEHANKADHLTVLAERVRSLPSDERVIRQKLAVMRVPNSESLSNPTQFRPLIAYYDDWIEKQANQTHIERAFLTVTNELNTEALATQEEGEKASLLKRASALQLQALKFQGEALIAKINAAFIHAVIQQPEFAGTLDDLAQYFNDPTADHFLVFKNQNIQAITRAELSNNATMPIHLIAQRFIQAMAAPAVA